MSSTPQKNIQPVTDITLSTRKGKCNNLSVLCIYYTMVYCNESGSHNWLKFKDDKQWSCKFVQSFVKGTGSICAKWLGYFMYTYLGGLNQTITQSDKIFWYTKIRFYTRAQVPDSVYLIYVLNAAEHQHLVDNAYTFVTEQRSDVVMQYFAKKRDWWTSTQEYIDRLQWAIGRRMYNKNQFSAFTPDDHGILDVQLLPVGQPRYNLPAVVTRTWAVRKNPLFALALLTNRIDENYSRRFDVLQSLLKLWKTALGIDNVKKDLKAVIQHVFVDAKDEIVNVMCTGATKFINFEPSRVLNHMPLPGSRNVVTDEDNAQITQFTKHSRTVLHAFLDVEQQPITMWMQHFHAGMWIMGFVSTDIGQLYLQYLILYVSHAFIVLVQDTLMKHKLLSLQKLWLKCTLLPNDTECGDAYKRVFAWLNKLFHRLSSDPKHAVALHDSLYSAWDLLDQPFRAYNEKCEPATRLSPLGICLGMPGARQVLQMNPSPTRSTQSILLHVLGAWHTVTVDENAKKLIENLNNVITQLNTKSKPESSPLLLMVAIQMFFVDTVGLAGNFAITQFSPEYWKPALKISTMLTELLKDRKQPMLPHTFEYLIQIENSHQAMEQSLMDALDALDRDPDERPQSWFYIKEENRGCILRVMENANKMRISAFEPTSISDFKTQFQWFLGPTGRIHSMQNKDLVLGYQSDEATLVPLDSTKTVAMWSTGDKSVIQTTQPTRAFNLQDTKGSLTFGFNAAPWPWTKKCPTTDVVKEQQWLVENGGHKSFVAINELT